MALLIFILILSILVLVHELGHYLVAKKMGIRVEEFGLGIPPKIFGKKIGGTIYSLNLLPFGGFVKVTGEDASTVTDDPRSFANKTPMQRIAVLVAGVFMNFVLAVFLFYIVLAHANFKTQYIPLIFDHSFKFGEPKIIGTVVSGVMENSNAAKAGIQLGENIVSIDGMPVNSVTDLRETLKDKLGQTVNVELMDVKNGIKGPIRFVQMQPQSDDDGKVILGVYITRAVSLDYSTGISKYVAGFIHAYNVMDFSFSSMGKLIDISFKEKSIQPVSQSVSGPVGIYDLVAGLLKYGGSNVFFSILDFIAVMSISLATINILPIPALDGGRVLFVIIEKILGKPVSAKIENTAHQWGFAILLGLLLLVTYKDIFN